jgi:hypothetical protein
MDTQPALDRDDAMLARLAEMDLSLAEKLHAAAMASEKSEETADLARVYQKVARSLRQSIALKHRIKRDVAQASRGAPSPQHQARVENRITMVRRAVTRVIFTETEGEAADWLCSLLEERIDLRIRQTAGVDISTLDETVTEVCEDLNLPRETAERWRDLPDPAPIEEPAVSGAILELSG